MWNLLKNFNAVRFFTWKGGTKKNNTYIVTKSFDYPVTSEKYN